MSKKDSFWFKHDSNAGRGLRIRKIQFIYGHWGKGVYWDVVEILRDQENYMYENDETSLQMLCEIIGCKDENKFLSWYKDCIKHGLLQENNTHFSSEKLIEVMKEWETKKANGSKGGRPKAKKNRNDNLTNNLNETETKPKRKLNGTIREEKRREDNINIDEIYNKYPSKCPVKKSTTGKSLKNKEKIKGLLKDYSKEHILEVIDLYIKECTKSNTYVKNFSTFLNNLPDISSLKASFVSVKDTETLQERAQRLTKEEQSRWA